MTESYYVKKRGFWRSHNLDIDLLLPLQSFIWCHITRVNKLCLTSCFYSSNTYLVPTMFLERETEKICYILRVWNKATTQICRQVEYQRGVKVL